MLDYKKRSGMMIQCLKSKLRILLIAGVMGAVAVSAETDTVLLCYAANVMRFTVTDGVWSRENDFALASNNYGGLTRSFFALASDGRRVFIGENGSTSRILEFDLAGTYLRTLAVVDKTVETMGISQDGRWVYATAGLNFSGATTDAAVYRYDAVTGAGGLFIENQGTNALGDVLWKFQIPRGITTDAEGNVWVSERSSGRVFKFSGEDGALLNTFTGLSGVQALSFVHQENTVYGAANISATYAIAVATGATTTYTISGINNRLGITWVQGFLYSGRWDTPDISRYDLGALTYDIAMTVPKNSRQIITVPRTPLRQTAGHLLLSETVSNRVTRVAVDTGGGVEADTVFAGGTGVTYAGLPLRQPRGIAAFSNTVYVAEGVTGGRILRFNKWGTFKEVTADFSETPYSGCVPTALALSPDGETLYVSDAHTLFLAGGGATWANVPTNGYYGTNSFGETIYKVQARSGDVSVFADAANCAAGETLLECHGVAVDACGDVYCTAWFNKTSALFQSPGKLYRFAPDGTRLASLSIGNPAACYYARGNVYSPSVTNTQIQGDGILFTGNGIQDFWWTSAGGSLTPFPKVLDLGSWRNYLDVEVINGCFLYTDPEYGLLWMRTGETAAVTVLEGLSTPSYLDYVTWTGPEPPPGGTLMTLK